MPPLESSLNRIAVLGTIGDEKESQALADFLGIPLLTSADETPEFLLSYQQSGLTVTLSEGKTEVELRAEWLSGKAAYRKGQPEMLSRALSLSKLDCPHIVDATAGLGRDTVVIAGLGAQVTAIERSPVIYSLLKDAHARALDDAIAEGWASQIELLYSDSVKGIGEAAAKRQVDEVFLDPMYPEKRKNAKAKKEMRLFQELLPKDPQQDGELLTAALDHAVYRVIVKRPIKGEFLAQRTPSFSIKGRSTRFDVYTKKKVS